jgi:two-component system heavy metal sensor histidine kinase CusS
MKRHAPSFRWRLALMSAGISGVILGGFTLAAWALMHRQLERTVEARLSVPLSRMTSRLRGNMDWKREIESKLFFAGSYIGAEDFEVAVFENRPEGYAYYGNNARWMKTAFYMESHIPTEEFVREFLASEERPAPDRDRDRGPGGPGGPERGERRPLPPIAAPVFLKAEDSKGKAWRVAIQSNPEVTIYLAMDLAEFNQEENRLRRNFLAALPLGLFAIGFGGWLISGRAMRPVQRITSAAKRMNALDLNQRIPHEHLESSEFSQLIDVLNDMMARLEKSFHQATRFTADASHELKTPIALMQAELSEAIKKCSPDAPEATIFHSLSEETHRLKQITQSLLLLSQVDSGKLNTYPETFDLSSQMHGLCEDAEVLCMSENITFTSQIQDNVEIKADRILFMQAVQNLLSNAVKYNRTGGKVECTMDQSEARIHIRFTNTGTPIPPDMQSHIFDRFFRIDSARNRKVDGFGLGLNLAKEIIRSHGGDLRLLKSDEQGTVFEIKVP